MSFKAQLCPLSHVLILNHYSFLARRATPQQEGSLCLTRTGNFLGFTNQKLVVSQSSGAINSWKSYFSTSSGTNLYISSVEM